MPGTIYHFDHHEFSTLETRYNGSGAYIDAVIKAWDVLGSNHTITTADLPRLLNHTQEMIVEKLTAGKTKVDGMELEPDKLFSIMKKPAGIEALNAAVNEANRYMKGYIPFNPHPIYKTVPLSAFKIEKGKACVSQEARENLRAQFSHRTTNEAQEKALQSWLKVRDLLNELAYPGQFFSPPAGVVRDGEWKINPGFISEIQ